MNIFRKSVHEQILKHRNRSKCKCAIHKAERTRLKLQNHSSNTFVVFAIINFDFH